LIDEAQDFAPTWFQCVLATMKDPDNGDLLIVSDGNQGVYRRKKVLWKALGVHASGRVVRMKPAKLDSNYRNTREIIALAADFATLTSSLDDDEMQIVPPDPSKCTRSIREKPVLYGESHRKAECQRVCKIVRGLLNGEWNGHALHAPLAPSEIAVLYPMLPAPSRNEFHDFLKDLRKIAPVIWLTDDKARQNRRKVAEDGIKVQTIHSAKGLEYRAVVVLWAAFLPCTFTPDLDEQRDRILMYVAMTRAKDYLAMTFSKGSRFITKIHHSGATEPARWN
jgi:superfamily I DNA/RNA helicase